MIIDRVAPNPPFALSRSRMIEADAETVMAAVQTANLLDTTMARLLSSARDLPNRLVARWRGQPVEHLPSSVTFAEWVRMDLEYIRLVSFWQDLKLLVLTVPSVLSRRGAS